jgi:RNA polymerase sigma factor (sigma-70 family)
MINEIELINSSLNGDRVSFGKIVRIYQSLICSITYNSIGDLHASEDLAQETFYAAWKNLKGLQDKSKFKYWLCGIARNLTNEYIREKYRNVTPQTQSLDNTINIPTSELNPRDAAISQEEETILWKSLKDIPEIYRETLVLYYREDQSIKSVAAALDITEDAVKQRLSRGRVMLKEQVSSFVENTLLKSKPSETFAIAIVAALPALTAQLTVPGIALTATKGSAAMKSAISFLSLGFILSPILANIDGTFAGVVGILGGISLSTMSIRSAKSSKERKFLYKASGAILIWLAIFYISIVFVPYYFKHTPWLSVISIITVIGFAILFIWIHRRIKLIQIETKTYVDQRKIWRNMNRRQWYETVLGIIVGLVCGMIPMYVSLMAKDWITAIIILLATMVNYTVFSARFRIYPQRIYKLSIWQMFYFYLLAVTVIFFRWESWRLVLNGTHFPLSQYMPNRIELILGISILYLFNLLLTYYSYKKFTKTSQP